MNKVLIYDDERLNYLAGKVAGMFSGITKKENLGNVALEIMVIRENAEEITKGSYSKKEKAEAKRALNQLRTIEKNIVKLYFFSRLGHGQNRKSPFLDYMISKYSSSPMP